MEGVPFTVGVGLPSDPSTLGSFCRRAEALGFSGLWAQDSLTNNSTSFDGLHELSFAAAVTERVRLGMSVLYSGLRHPAMLAREIATIDQLSGGRVIAGIGVGNSYHRPKLDALGIATRPPAQRLVEGIGVMRAVWTDGEASYDGEMFSFSGVPWQPKPVQRPGPPVWIGARGERALVRAARIADGWSGAGPVGTEEFLGQLDVVNRALDEHGRDRAAFTVSKGVYVAVEPTKERARKYLTEFFDRVYGQNPVYASDGMADRVAVFGSPEDCAEQLSVLANAGVDDLVLHSPYAARDQLDALGNVVELLRGHRPAGRNDR